MEFTGFSAEGFNLLIENRIRNDKTFYEAQKPQIKQLVQEPFYALIEKMTPTMLQIDPLFVIAPHRQLSRVRRDNRYTKDKSLYRSNMWITFGRMKGAFASRPCYYFEVTPEYWGYGCGYYQAPTNEMQLAREWMLKQDARFLKAYDAVTHSDFTLFGECYKRPKFPDAPAQYQDWLNRKNLGVSWESTDHTPVLNGSFVDKMLQDMLQIAPFYHLLCAVKEISCAGKSEVQ